MEPSKTDKFNKLARDLKLGSTSAGQRIFDRWSKPIFKYIFVRTGMRHVAEDLTQDVFLKIINKIDTFDEEKGMFTQWIWGIVKNVLVDYYREKERLHGELPENAEIINEKDSPLMRAEMREILEIISHFSSEEREIFHLHYFSDVSYEELSKLTGKSKGALRVIVHRLREKIKLKIQ